MKLRTVLQSLVITIAVSGAMTSGTLAAEPSDSQRQAMDVKIQELRDRLALTLEQEQKLAPILEQRNEKLKALWAQRDPDSSRREKRALLGQAKEIQEDFTRQIKPILSAEQMREWEAFRKEARDEAVRRYRSGQN
jgi:hypothetical protein